MTTTVRTGLIGCGKIARIHARALRDLPEADFVAVCDTDEERARAFASEHGAQDVYASAGELLKSGAVEAVLICAPHPAHAALVVAAAEAGVHVLCEKPISITLAAADQMIEAPTKPESSSASSSSAASGPPPAASARRSTTAVSAS